MAASMLRSAATSALRHRPSSVLHVVGASSSPPATATMAGNYARRHFSATNDSSAAREEQMKRVEMAMVEETKAELLRQMMLEEATDSGKITAAKRARTEELAYYLGTQVVPVAPAAADVDKHLLLALLVRSSRMEQEMEKLRSSAAKAEEEMQKLRSEVDELRQECL